MLDRMFLNQQIPAIELVASAQTQNAASGASLVIDKPTGTVSGDLMVAIMFNDRSSVTWTGDTGWTEIADQGTGVNARIAYKVATGSEGSAYTFTASSSSNICTGAIITFRGAAYDTIGVISTSSASNVQTAGAITVGADGSVLLAAFANRGASRTYSNQTSGLVSLVTDGDATAPSYAVFYQTNVAAGSTGTKSATVSSSSTAYSQFLMSLKPA